MLYLRLHLHSEQFPNLSNNNKCDIIRKNLERHETNKNGRGDRAALTSDRQKRCPACGWAPLTHIQMKQNENVNFGTNHSGLPQQQNRRDWVKIFKCRWGEGGIWGANRCWDRLLSVSPSNSTFAPAAFKNCDSLSSILLLRKATVIWPKVYISISFISICLSDTHPLADRRFHLS